MTNCNKPLTIDGKPLKVALMAKHHCINFCAIV